MSNLRKYKNSAVLAICFLLFVLFFYAAVSKLIEYEQFETQLLASPLLGNFAEWIAWVIPAVEIIVSLMLFVPRLRLIALHASFYLLFIFTTYIFLILNFSDSIPCSCGGVLEDLGWTEHLIFNIVFIFLALMGIILKTMPRHRSNYKNGKK